jgi:hypothetical protein
MCACFVPVRACRVAHHARTDGARVFVVGDHAEVGTGLSTLPSGVVVCVVAGSAEMVAGRHFRKVGRWAHRQTGVTTRERWDGT